MMSRRSENFRRELVGRKEMFTNATNVDCTPTSIVLLEKTNEEES